MVATHFSRAVQHVAGGRPGRERVARNERSSERGRGAQRPRAPAHFTTNEPSRFPDPAHFTTNEPFKIPRTGTTRY